MNFSEFKFQVRKEQLARFLELILLPRACMKVSAWGERTCKPWAFTYVLDITNCVVIVTPDRLNHQMEKLSALSRAEQTDWIESLPILSQHLLCHEGVASRLFATRHSHLHAISYLSCNWNVVMDDEFQSGSLPRLVLGTAVPEFFWYREKQWQIYKKLYFCVGSRSLSWTEAMLLVPSTAFVPVLSSITQNFYN
jgi:hypothetical protein